MSEIIRYLFIIPAILISVAVHEFSHGYVAYKLGDPTAKNMGRLTLNPLKHLDFVGTLMLILVQFGWAKPVPINPMYFKDVKKGTVLVGLAGPLSNIAFAIFTLCIYIILGSVFNSYIITNIITNFLLFLYLININLAAFNLLPIPPLDGSKIFGGLLPRKWYYQLLSYESYFGIIFLLIVYFSPGLLSMIMTPITNFLGTAIVILLGPLQKMLNMYLLLF